MPKIGEIVCHCVHYSSSKVVAGEGLWYDMHDIGDEHLVNIRGRVQKVKWVVLCRDCDRAFSGIVGAEVLMEDSPIVLQRNINLANNTRN